MKFSNETRRGIRGLFMGCFGINLFMFLMVMEAWGGGIVPSYLPFLILGSAILCLVGYAQNKPLETEDDDE
jgi:hypothetical protein